MPSIQNADWLEELKTAKIVEGYVIHKNESDESPFNFFAEINIDNSRLWEIFTEMLLSYTEEISLIFGYVDHEPFYSQYMDKAEILKSIENYENEFVQDGYLEFGIIYHDEKKLKEIFVKRPKYIQFWGTDEKEFKTIMSKFSLYEIEDLQFIDEFPMVTKSLKMLDENALNTTEIINSLKEKFVDE
jgi:hypothetical protein